MKDLTILQIANLIVKFYLALLLVHIVLAGLGFMGYIILINLYQT